MANKLAPYKQPYFLDNIQEWWDMNSTEFHTLDEMFEDYTKRQLHTLEYEAALGYDDFRKCIYKQGIIVISEDPRLYGQMAHWRPSDDMVMRHEKLVEDLQESKFRAEQAAYKARTS